MYRQHSTTLQISTPNWEGQNPETILPGANDHYNYNHQDFSRFKDFKKQLCKHNEDDLTRIIFASKTIPKISRFHNPPELSHLGFMGMTAKLKFVLSILCGIDSDAG